MSDLTQLLEERATRRPPDGTDRLRARIDATLAGRGPGIQAAPRRRIPGFAFAAIAGLAVLAVVGATVLGTRTPSDGTTDPSVVATTVPSTTSVAPSTTDPIVDTTAAPATSATPTTVPETSTGPQVLSDTTEPAVVDVLVADDGVLAVGGGGIWYSPDGRAWDKVFARDDARIFGIAEHAGGFTAIGMCGLEWCDFATSWTSPDGRVWTEIDSPLEDTWFTYFNDIVPGGPGLIAVGQDPEYASAAVWTSPDGVAWTRVWRALNVNSAMYSIEPVGSGFVAVGRVSHPNGPGEEEDAAVWTSGDGSDWSLVSIDRSVFGAPDAGDIADWTYWSARAAVEFDGRLVVGGQALDDQRLEAVTAAIWVQNAGSWDRVEPPEFERAAITGLAVVDDSLLAVGSRLGGLVVWVSEDAMSWRAVDVGLPAGQIYDIAILDGDVLLAGTDLRSAAIWVFSASEIVEAD